MALLEYFLKKEVPRESKTRKYILIKSSEPRKLRMYRGTFVVYGINDVKCDNMAWSIFQINDIMEIRFS